MNRFIRNLPYVFLFLVLATFTDVKSAHAEYSLRQCFYESVSMLFSKPMEALRFLDIQYLTKYGEEIRGRQPTNEEVTIGRNILVRILTEESNGKIVPRSIVPDMYQKKERFRTVTGTLRVKGGVMSGEHRFKVSLKPTECVVTEVSIGGFYSLKAKMREAYQADEDRLPQR